MGFVEAQAETHWELISPYKPSPKLLVLVQLPDGALQVPMSSSYIASVWRMKRISKTFIASDIASFQCCVLTGAQGLLAMDVCIMVHLLLLVSFCHNASGKRPDEL